MYFDKLTVVIESITGRLNYVQISAKHNLTFISFPWNKISQAAYQKASRFLV